MHKIHIVVGVRPDLIRAAQLIDTLTAFDTSWDCKVIHTGQHYDHELAQDYIDELSIPHCVVLSDIGHGTGISQIASILNSYDEYLTQDPPDLILIMGNSNSALACAMAGKKRGHRLGHLDAGLRAYDEGLNEEVNDALIDRLCSLHFTASEEAAINLIREGYENSQIIEVGNLRGDSVFINLGHAEDSRALDRFGLKAGGYALVTFHHPETLMQPKFILELMTYLERLSERLPVLAILHPNTQYMLEDIFDMEGADPSNLQFVSSQPYRDMLRLIKSAALVITDSQGLQEETSILGVQCLTLGHATNRMVTLSKGTNTLHSYDLAGIESRVSDIVGGHLREAFAIEAWDGKTSQRIAKYISGI